MKKTQGQLSREEPGWMTAARVVIGALVIIFELGIIYVVFLGGKSALIFFLLLIVIAGAVLIHMINVRL